MAIERRTKVIESCKEIVRGVLFKPAGPYQPDQVTLVDALPDAEFKGKLDTTYVAAGYCFDDGGRLAEIGSDLVRYIWTIEYMIFAQNGVWGKNVADTVANAFKIGDNAPLLAIGTSREPTGETVVVTYSQAQRVIVRSPRPWEAHVWMTRVKLEDYFYSSQP